MDGKTLYVILTANAAAYRAALHGASDDTKQFGRDVDDMGRRVDQSGKEVDKMSGRIRIVADALTLLGPASIPIIGIATPALAGLAGMLGVTVVSAGATMLAFRGLTDVLTTMKSAALDPSSANLTKLHEQLVNLPPDTRAFVDELRSMSPVLDTLTASAAHGVFPGLTTGLEDLRSMTPVVANLLEEAASTAGDMAAETADAFDSARGREFVRFLTAEVRPGVEDLLHSVGNLAAGAGSMWEAFAPTNHQFGDWLVGQTQDFKGWADALDGTQGFQDFLAYLDQTGPKVASAMGAVGNALLQIVEAAAPLGGPVLQGITAAADAIAAIADSPLGTALFTAAAATTLLNRGLQLTSGLLTKIGVQQVGGGAITASSLRSGSATVSTPAALAAYRASSAATDALRASETAASRAHAQYIGALRANSVARELIPGSKATTGMVAAVDRLNAANETVAANAGRVAEAERTRAAAFRQTAKVAAGAAAGVGAMALVTTGVADDVGLSNTAMLGMVGTMAGPWGTAIGVGVGALLDMKAAANGAKDATHDFASTVDQDFVTLSAYGAAVDQLSAKFDEYRAKTTGSNPVTDFLTKAYTPAGLMQTLDTDFGGYATSQGGKNDAAEAAAIASQEALGNAAVQLGTQMGMPTKTVADLDAVLTHAQPAMAALGISTEDLISTMDGSGTANIMDFGFAILDYQTHADSTAGRTDALAASVADLGNRALSTADSAGVMSSALEALLSPALSAEEATDAWHVSLAKLESDLKKGVGFKGFSEAALANKAVTRDYANTSIERLKALAGVSTTTQDDMANAVAATRREFIKSGIAAGIDADVIRRRANALGLTPKLVRTVFKSVGVEAADLRARQLRRTFQAMPKNVQTYIRANGIPQTVGQVNALVQKYHLTEKQRTALLSIRDLASKPIGDILAKLHIVDRTNPSPSINVSSNAAGVVGATNALLATLHDKTVTVNVRKVGGGLGPTSSADGGVVPKTGLGYADRHHYLLADGERITSNRYGQADAYAPILQAINDNAPRSQIRGMLADGGTVGSYRRYGSEQVNRGGGAHTVIVQSRMPDKLDLIVDGRSFTAYVRGHAADVTRKQIEAVNEADVATDRRDWR